MSSIQTSTHLPALAEPHQREAVSRQLESVLHDMIDLGLIAEQMRWAAVGPHSWTLRMALEALLGAWRRLAERLAERTVALGRVPAVQARAVVDGSAVDAVTTGPIEDHSAVWSLTHRVAQVAERARARAASIAPMDPVSEAVLIEVVGCLEKHQWMLRAQLDARGRGTD
jgi:starvation-inducible DNA-binding protein